MKTNDQVAFPSDPRYSMNDRGMTLRDFFANSAMQAYIQDHLKYKRENKIGWCVADITDSAYVFADAMLKQREL